jgi:hypothetical protein
LNARQITEYLILAYPERTSWLKRLYEEYTLELTHQKNDIHLLFEEALSFLYAIAKRGNGAK